MNSAVMIVDNYDSFTYNLAQGFGALGFSPSVVRADEIDVDRTAAQPPAVLVISPGPGRPESAWYSVAAIRALSGRVPVLGICLGHQAIAVAFGARVKHAPAPVHGSACEIIHDGGPPFEGLPQRVRAGRYHSLIVDEGGLPDELTVSARTHDGLIMAVRHRSHPTYGLQFHPESILTKSGPQILRNVLRISGLVS
jgi:anthranilate synthase/aminodeoxychorismate synthase-like glutamine amidotransferase